MKNKNINIVYLILMLIGTYILFKEISEFNIYIILFSLSFLILIQWVWTITLDTLSSNPFLRTKK